MSCNGYSSYSLMGNWYEERISQGKQKENSQSVANTSRILRKKTDPILAITKNGKMQPVSRILRKNKAQFNSVIMDTGSREFTPLTQESFRKSLLENFYKHKDLRPVKKRSISVGGGFSERKNELFQTSGVAKIQLIDERNAHQQYVKRKYPQNFTNFGSTLQSHDKHHKKMFNITTYSASFNNSRTKTNPKSFSSKIRQRRNIIGQAPKNNFSRGKKVSTLLIGEQYMDFEDPQKNSLVQKSWIYGLDPTMRKVEEKLNRTLRGLGGKATNQTILARMAQKRLENGYGYGRDLHNSLALERGEKQFFPTINKPGIFRRIRSKITNQRNKSLTYKQILSSFVEN